MDDKNTFDLLEKLEELEKPKLVEIVILVSLIGITTGGSIFEISNTINEGLETHTSKCLDQNTKYCLENTKYSRLTDVLKSLESLLRDALEQLKKEH
ncbi:MAG: hypothetical protein DRR16_15490 [Candidatus Parabeggiatoa sp. nov. 3]|nr:MAG: hypothetical protein DRR00_30860 [Gammaproteobacteria bacterium]RKZ84154.1 MAG: hypothetical protein DRR16_15490 [Gammaproteobacteria bacterium]HEW98626.1 hypothetical protein [Beggiatoa sp.]